MICQVFISKDQGAIAYTTYEVTTPAAPEKVLFLIPIAILLPKMVEWFRRRWRDKKTGY